MSKQFPKRLLCVLLVIALLSGFAIPVGAAEETPTVTWEQVDNSAVQIKPMTAMEPQDEPAPYADTDIVRVSIFLENQSTIEAGYSTENIARNTEAMAYRADLQNKQEAITASIERKVGEKLDVVWNLTLAANIISANVEYGQIEAIEDVPGVEKVLIETRYEPDVVAQEESNDPNMATSSKQIGSSIAWAAGYTGAGSRIAIIDTGADTDHQSFSAGGLQYSLNYLAGRNDMTLDEYIEYLDLLDAKEIASVAELLNASVDAEHAYHNIKIPYGYNYVDRDYDVTHDNDTQGSHGSHVAGISTANAYIPTGDGTFVRALESVMVQGVAPDAQLLPMKVFGKAGGAWDSDYMAAIEDAVILGCDAVNLSLGSGAPGTSRNANAAYQEILENLQNSGTVVTMSAGNSYSWVENAYNVGYLYSDDVSMQTSGSPGSFTNSLSVASINNDGATGLYVSVDGMMIVYNETDYSNEPFTTIAGEHEYVFIDGFGTAEDWAVVGETLKGKIALCSRGTTSFFQKAEAAVEAGAIATLIYNNAAGVINMDLTDYSYTQPVASITQAEGAAIRVASTPVTDDAGNVLYYTGKMTVSAGVGSTQYNSQYSVFSEFSSWGVPGSLELKPEITAPGGYIYSINGVDKSGTAYEVNSGTSMSAPQVAGMAALVAQYIRDAGLEKKTGLDTRTLTQSLLTSTAEPLREEASEGNYWSILRQGSGLGNVGAAVSADSYILMDEGMNAGAADGKVKVELGDDPNRDGKYTVSFSLNNLTEQEKAFELYADFFTQQYFQYYANGDMSMDELSWYMDTWTMEMPVITTWTVDGKVVKPTGEVDGLDFNGDGIINSADGQAILDYVVGVSTGLNLLDKADLDADGDVDTYDAYLFFKELGTSSVVIPGGSAVRVSVEIELTEQWDQVIETYETNGLYIEGFLYARSLTDAEGVAGTTHSIPVLGFYGNWTDPSMFDQGSYPEFAAGDEVRTPYLGSLSSNTYAITYKDEPGVLYNFGGNPVVPDETYMPERNAINSKNGDKISRISFTAIRNASESRFLVENVTADETITETNLGSVSSAYYHVNGGQWLSYGAYIKPSFSIKGANEGDLLKMSLTLAPEYYEMGTDEAGNLLIDWDALGEGATYSMIATVDNTAPTLEGVFLDLLNNTLVVKGHDNQYISAVALYSKSGSKLYTCTGAKQDIQPNESAEYTLDLTGIRGSKFMIQITDYAMNAVTYILETQIGEPIDYTGRMFGFANESARGSSGNRWVEIEPKQLYYRDETYHDGMEDFTLTSVNVIAAEYVGGYVFMACDDDYFYVAEHDDLSAVEKVCYYGNLNVQGMAMNYADNQMYFITSSYGQEVDEPNRIYTLDLLTGEITLQYTVTIINEMFSTYNDLNSLAIDDEGNFYAVSAGSSTSSFLYSWTNEDAVNGAIEDLITVDYSHAMWGDTDFYGRYASLAWDHDNDILYMASSNEPGGLQSYYVLVTLDTVTGKGTKVTSYSGEQSTSYASRLGMTIYGLYIVSSSKVSFPTAETVSSIALDRTEASYLKGTTFPLTASVYPWTLDDKTVTWTTSDPNVAIVDDYGNVTTIGVGNAVITATTNAAPNLSATCVVTSEAPPTFQFSGLVYDKDSSTYWSDFSTDDLTAWTAASGKSNPFIAGGLVDDTIYVHDGDYMYSVDPNTFAVSAYGRIASDWLWSDMAGAPLTDDGLFGFPLGLSYGGTLLTLMYPSEDSLLYWDFTSTYAKDPMAVIAHIGSGTYDYDIYTDCPANFYYVLTESGQLWKFNVFTYHNGENYTCTREYLGSTGLDLTGVSAITDGVYASMEYDEATGYLLVSAYTEGSTAKLYAIHPDVLLPAEIGSFGENVWPVVSLYQYERATDLTVKLRPSTATIYEGDTVQLSAKVILGTTNQLTWSTSDAAIATVDANGLVTGTGEGTVTITATTVDTNKEGNTVSASVTISVTGLMDVDTRFNAQISTAEGAKWVSIDTDTMTATTMANATTTFTGAGYGGDGKLYGTNADPTDEYAMGNIYQVDTANNFTETTGSEVSSYWSILDMTYAPALEFEAENWYGEIVTLTGFDMPLFVSNGQNVVFLTDYVAGSLSGWSQLWFYYTDMSAIAYIQPTVFRGNPAQMFLILGADGRLHQFLITPTLSEDDGESVEYSLNRTVYGDIGMKFDNYQALSMAFDGKGLIIADSSKGAADLYYVDLTAETLSCGKIGRLPNATAITGLYTDAQVTGTNAIDVVETMSVQEAIETNLSAEPVFEAEIAESSAPVSMAESIALTPVVEDAKPTSDTVTAPTEATVTIDVTTDVAATSGLITVSYDAAKLALESAIINGTYSAKVEEDGKLTFGYVSMTEIPAEGTIATLTFKVLEAVDSVVTVEHKQVNNTKGGTETLTVEFEHKNTEIRGAIEATCTTAGYTGDTYCLDCGRMIQKGQIIEAKDHTFGEWETVKEATCMAEGQQKRTCVCGETEYRETDMTAHKYTAEVTAPTCTEMGYTTYTCSVCGSSYKDDYVAPTGHSFGEWETVKEATCTAKGQEKRTCACGETEYRDTDMTAHSYTEETVEPTCTKAGYVMNVCSDCGHNYIVEIIEATGHDYEAVVTPATCTEQGYTTYTCKACGDTYVDDYTDALGHSFGQWVITTEPGCTTEGVETRTCEICSETETRAIPAYCPAEDFTDVDTKQWYHEGICYVIRNGLMNGKAEGIFAPNANLTRAELVTVLYRMAGTPSVEGMSNPFADVSAEAWYADAVIWAYNEGVVKGVSTTAFAPNVSITREQIATILFRFTGAEKVEENALADFTDANTISDYAVDAMNWAAANGFITGMGDGTLAPKSTATRAQIATILMRYCENFN